MNDKNILELIKIMDLHERQIQSIVVTLDKVAKTMERMQEEVDTLISYANVSKK